MSLSVRSPDALGVEARAAIANDPTTMRSDLQHAEPAVAMALTPMKRT